MRSETHLFPAVCANQLVSQSVSADFVELDYSWATSGWQSAVRMESRRGRTQSVDLLLSDGDLAFYFWNSPVGEVFPRHWTVINDWHPIIRDLDISPWNIGWCSQRLNLRQTISDCLSLRWRSWSLNRTTWVLQCLSDYTDRVLIYLNKLNLSWNLLQIDSDSANKLNNY